MHWLWHRDDETTDLDMLREWAADEGLGDGDWSVRTYVEIHGWEPLTTCNQCERPLPEDHMRMLCERCESRLVRDARAERARREWNADVAADPEMGRRA